MTWKPPSIVTVHAGPEHAAGPLDRLPLRDRLDLAARLADRLVGHVLRPGNAAAVERQLAYVRSESLVPVGDVDPEHYEVVTRNCATDMLVHAGSRGKGGSLVRRLLGERPGPGPEGRADDGTAPAGLLVDDAERALLRQWCDGGVLGYFIVTDLVDEHAVLHNLEDDLDYRVFTGRSQIGATRSPRGSRCPAGCCPWGRSGSSRERRRSSRRTTSGVSCTAS